jgi:UDP-N-acetylglucosamine acyltransferase
MSKIHQTAIIGKNVILENDVEIGPYVILEGNIKISNNTKIISHVHIQGDVTIGKNNLIYPFCSIGFSPQDDKFKNEESKVMIGDNNIIRENVTINGGSNIGNDWSKTKNTTSIGNNCNLFIGSHLGHNVYIGNNVTLTNNVAVGGHCFIDDYVLIGGNSAIHQHLKIGKYALIAGCIGVGANVPDYAFVQNAAQGFVGGINIIGLKRNNFSLAEISFIQKIYKILHNNEISFQNKTVLLEEINCNNEFELNAKENVLAYLKNLGRYGLIKFAL